MYIVVKYAHMCKSAHVCTSVEFTGHVSSLISSPPFIYLFIFKMGFLHRTLLIWLRSFKALPLRLHITQHCHQHYRWVPPCPEIFMRVLGNRTQNIMFAWRKWYWLSHLSSPLTLFRLIIQYDKSLSSFLVVLLFTPIDCSISFL